MNLPDFVFTIAIINNVLLSKGFGLSLFLVERAEFGELLRLSVAVSGVTLISAIMLYPVFFLTGGFATFLFCVIIGVMVGEICRLIFFTGSERDMVCLLGGNSAVAGMLILSSGPVPSFFAFIMSVFAMLAGYLGISLLLIAALSRLRMCSFSYPFSESSVFFLTAGLLGMALRGFF